MYIVLAIACTCKVVNQSCHTDFLFRQPYIRLIRVGYTRSVPTVISGMVEGGVCPGTWLHALYYHN